ncbi:MAG: hypothetical protein ACRC8P_02835 [Spiroplasma sp.]
MGRIIEILKEFQNNSHSVPLVYLVVNFSLTSRTLQKAIQRINSLLSEISNCKIIKYKDKLVIVGDNSEFAINNLLRKLLKISDNNLITIHQLLLCFIWESQPLSSSKLIDLIDSDLYSLKQKLNLINNFFQYYQLKLRLKFKTKKGWMLVGCEQDLRILTTKILINFSNLSYPNFYFNSSLFYLFNKLEKVLLENNIYNYYFHEICYFLIVLIKRIKINSLLLNNDYCHFLLKQLVEHKSAIKYDYNNLINLLQKNFDLKINKYEVSYLKSLMVFNQKNFNNSFFSKSFFNLKNFIFDLILEKYQFPLAIKNFKMTLNSFLKENYLKIVFNFYKSFSFSEIKENPFSIDDSSFYGWEILSIISFAFKKFRINFNFNLFVNNYFLMNFNSLYLQKNQKNWVVPLYYQKVSNSYYEINQIILFIKNRYPNIILKSLNINNNVYKFNFLNKRYSILLDNDVTLNLLRLKKVFLISHNHLQSNIDLAIKMIMFNKVCSSILIFDFFISQKFYSLKTFLNFFQDLLIRRFKINYYDFNLKDAFIYKKFFQANILLIHKLIPINNIELPIILVYLKSPLFFHKRNPIYFIFIKFTDSNDLYQYDWIISYLNIVKNNLDSKITNIKKLYKILNDSLSYKSLVFS